MELRKGETAMLSFQEIQGLLARAALHFPAVF
jgi:hypothetical protein